MYIDHSGDEIEYRNWSATDFIRCDNFINILITNPAQISTYNAFYNKNKEFITSFTVQLDANDIPIPNNAYWFRLSNSTARLSKYTIIMGDLKSLALITETAENLTVLTQLTTSTKFATDLTVGTINTTTGEEMTNPTRARTGYIKVNTTKITVNNTTGIYRILACLYSSQSAENFLSSTEYYDDNFTIINQEVKYVRLLFRKEDSSTKFGNVDLKTIYKSIYINEETDDDDEKEGFMVNFEIGGINTTTGTDVTTRARIRSGFIKSNCDIKIKNKTTSMIYLYYFDFNKVLIKVKNDYTSQNIIQHNGYIRLVLRKNDSSQFTASDIENSTKDIIFIQDISNPLPDYWINHVNEKIQNIYDNGISMRMRGDGFIFLTDVHFENNYMMSPNIIRYLKKYINVQKVVFGGDFLHGGDFFNPDNSKAIAKAIMREFMSMFGGIPIVVSPGNHDFNTSYGTATAEKTINEGEVYDICTRQIESVVNTNTLPYFYFDNPSQKIRYFVLDTGEGGNFADRHADDAIPYTDQLTWLQNNILDIDNTWNIIVIQHLFFSPATVESSNPIQVSGSYGTPLIAILDAIQADDSKPRVFAVIVGHVHRDYSILASGGYYCISTTCDAGGASASVYDSNYPTRTEGTPTEQAFDVFQFDIRNNKIYATRIGAGTNREWSYI